MDLCQQMQWPSLMLTLVLVLAQSIWTMLVAVVVRVTSQNVPVALLLVAATVILKMLESDVKVNYNLSVPQVEGIMCTDDK